MKAGITSWFNGLWAQPAKQVSALQPKPQPAPPAYKPPTGPPCFFVVDEFKTREIDVDGDGVGDLTHGEVVERVIQSRAPGVKVNRMEVSPEVLQGESFLKHLGERFREIRQFLDQGGNCAGVNLSLAHELLFFWPLINNDVTTSENIVERRDAAKEYFAHSINCGSRYWKEAVEGMEAIAKRCPVYLSAGNNGNTMLNTLTLAEGVHKVGAVDAQGEKTHFTASHGLINRFAKGVLAVHKVDGGFDLTGSGRAEVLDQEVSGGKSRIEQFIGRPVTEAVMSPAEFQKIVKEMTAIEMLSWGAAADSAPANPNAMKVCLAQFNSKLLSADQLVRVGLLPRQYEDKPWYGYAPDGQLKGLFQKDAAGHIVYDPDRSGRPAAVSEICGTSFAAPWAMADDYVKRSA